MTTSRTTAARLLRAVRRRIGRARRVIRRAVRVRPILTVVVAGTGDAAATMAAVAASAVPRRWVELLDSSGTPHGEALIAAVRRARGTHALIIAAGDTVGPEYLAAVARRADRGVAVLGGPAADDGSGVTPRDRLAADLGELRGVALPVEAVTDAVAGHEPAPLLLARLLVAGGCPIVSCPAEVRRSYRPARAEPADEQHVETGVEAIFATLTSIAGLPQTHPQPVVAAAMSAAVAPLNRAVRADPALRPELLARAAEIAGFDYGAFNEGLGRDLAILYVALPFADTAANIAARRVRDAGLIVDLVTADFSRLRGVDESAEPLWREFVARRIQLRGRATAHGEWGATARFCDEGAAWITARELRGGAYRSVYSRTMFPGAHLLAARYKIAHPDTPWLAEFSDPQLINPRGETRHSKGEPDAALLAELGTAMRERGFAPPDGDNVWEWCERVTYALADTIMFTNEAQREFMLGYCADPAVARRAAGHAVVSHHPSPPASMYTLTGPGYPLDRGLVHIAYFGAFYLTRTLTEVVSALAELAPAERTRLRLHVFTSKPESLRDEARAAGVEDVVIANGFVPFADYLALTTRFDVLVVNDYATAGALERNPFLPAKYADYRASGTPVWGIVEAGSVLSGLPLAYRSELGDVAGAAAVLGRLATGDEPAG